VIVVGPLTLLTATFVSEDLACVAAGVLIARGELSALAAITACAGGIFLGDVGLWILGRMSHRYMWAFGFVQRRVSEEQLARGRQWLERHAAAAIVVSRFTPGTRLPLYVAAGVVNLSFLRFSTWTLLAAAAWTPLLVLASAEAGRNIVPRGASGMPLMVAALGTVLALTRIVPITVSARRLVWFRRLRHWEFWPQWLFYLPVVCWVFWLSLRHRGVKAIAASNPGMQDGGIVGESKSEILARLPAACTIPFIKVASGCDTAQTLSAIEARNWVWPLIAKPDVGQRGMGVRLIRDSLQLHDYLRDARSDAILQPYHPGPFEAGVFYVRMPGESEGRIFSITDKRFPVIAGNGYSTVAELIDAHPRYRLQRNVFLARHHEIAGTVLARDERLQLAIAGNHAQGTAFYDGQHLWTPMLERRIDEIARQFGDFYIGRFDIRYSDVDAFKAGRDLAIVELNGATSESTNIYDPTTSLLRAYRILFEQWRLVFAIGAENLRRNASASSSCHLFGLLIEHLRSRPTLLLSD
jgi:membrane protein DedA with SNARE-associated domain